MNPQAKAKRICIVLPAHWEAQHGGAEYQAHFLADALAEAGYDVHWLSRRVPGPDTARTHTVHQIARQEGIRRRGFFFDAPALTGLLRRLKPDLIYQRVGGAYTGIATRYALKSGCGMIWHVARDDEVTPNPSLASALRNPFRMVDKALLEYGARRAPCLVVQTEAQKELLARHYGRRDSVLIPNFHPVPEEQPDKRLPFKVVWVANFKKVKRPELFVELASRFSDTPGIEFIMAGAPLPNSPWQRDLEMRIAALPNLRYLGRLTQPEVNRLLADAHVLVNTSEYEGLPNTFIQAWMRQVVVFSLSLNPGGYLSVPGLGACTGDLDVLEIRLHALLSTPAQLALDGSAASEFSRREFSQDNLSRLLDLISRLC